MALAACPMSHPLLRWPLVRREHREGNILKDQAYCERIGASPLNPLECELTRVTSEVSLPPLEIIMSRRLGRWENPQDRENPPRRRYDPRSSGLHLLGRWRR